MHQTRQEAAEVLVVDQDLVMVGAEELRGAPRVLELVEAGIVLVADAEGLDRAVEDGGHDGHDRARIDAPAQERAEGDVGHEAARGRSR